jgi:PEP-CTERM motif-containing protein
MKFLSMNPRLLTLAAVLLLAAPTLYAIPMNGSLQVRLMDGSNTQTLVCCNGGDGRLVVGPITFGLWTVHQLLVTGFPFAPNSFPQGTLSLSYTVFSAAGAGSLQILVSQNDYDANYEGFAFAAGGTQPPGAGASFGLFGGNSNSLFDTSRSLASSGPLTGTSFNFNTRGAGNVVNPYSLTYSTTITAPTTGSGTFTYQGVALVNSVPEPSSIVTLGAALFGFALWRIRQRDGC